MKIRRLPKQSCDPARGYTDAEEPALHSALDICAKGVRTKVLRWI